VIDWKSWVIKEQPCELSENDRGHVIGGQSELEHVAGEHEPGLLLPFVTAQNRFQTLHEALKHWTDPIDIGSK